MADNKQRDWVQILVAPLLIGLIGTALAAWFTWQQNQQQNSVEERRAESAQEIEDQRTQDAALQGYLDQMGSLLLHEGLRNSELDSNVRMLARARTQTVLQTLDPDRKFNVTQFLIETDLIQGMDGEAPVISLAGAPLSDMVLRGAPLSGADLRYADLRGTDLRYADLSGADLRGTDLRGADLRGANLRGADLSGADLEGAQGVTDDQLAEASSLNGATMPDGSKHP